MLERKIQRIFLLFCLAVLFLPAFVLADIEGQAVKFFIEASRDIKHREELEAVLKRVSPKAYFYIESDWYGNLTEGEKEKITNILQEVSQEFDQAIYPKLTLTYGYEWKPGIDKDEHITILFHQMAEGAAGYFNDGDEYPRTQNQRSNEREMIYLSAEYLKAPLLKSYLAHELTHLIGFNQKDRLRGITEEVWLNEARAEYSPTLLGYDKAYQGSNLQQRVGVFLQNPSDSLTYWGEKQSDYGVINVFVQYLVDHYGVGILVDSLRSAEIGIASIEKVLKENEIQKDFSGIFSDWLIAVFLNDCKLNKRYCYKSEHLQSLKLVPSLILLPATQKTEFFLDYNTAPLAGNWYRIVGGGEELTVTFQGEAGAQFKVPYVLCQDSQSCQVDFLKLDELQKGELSFDDFDKHYSSLTLIPFAQEQLGLGSELPYNFSISAKAISQNEDEQLMAELKERIAQLQAQIAELKTKIAAILNKRISCQRLNSNLYYGLSSSEVHCLQEFLKQQGGDIYPEGLISGFFGSLTQKAVIRFQEKYIAEILGPVGETKGTGFVGPLTRAKINQMLNP